MQRKHQRTLDLIYSRPVSANVRWADIKALFVELGGQVAEREGSRVLVRLVCLATDGYSTDPIPSRPRTRAQWRPFANGSMITE